MSDNYILYRIVSDNDILYRIVSDNYILYRIVSDNYTCLLNFCRATSYYSLINIYTQSS